MSETSSPSPPIRPCGSRIKCGMTRQIVWNGTQVSLYVIPVELVPVEMGSGNVPSSPPLCPWIPHQVRDDTWKDVRDDPPEADLTACPALPLP
jgi:hypothetical protein